MSVVDPRLLGGKRPHRKKRRKGVSPSTIWRWKKKVQYVTKRTKWRPKVKSKEHAKALMAHSFFSGLDWDGLWLRSLASPWKPGGGGSTTPDCGKSGGQSRPAFVCTHIHRST